MGMNSNQIEDLIKKYFEYMMDLNKSIRTLKKKIKNETEILEALLNEEKEYVDMITSLNTGKGYYHDISMLPTEIEATINSGPNYTKEQLENLRHNYELAVAAENKQKERYEELRSTIVERSANIKKYKKSIANDKRKLTKRQKEYDSNFLKVKEYDKKLEKLNRKTE